jgi:hypothetical protein
MKLAAGLLAGTVLLAPALAAADYYAYTTESGTLAFTDEEKRVPARYRDGAERKPDQDLASYSRLTVVPKGATFAPSPELLATPADDAVAPAPVAAAPAPGGVRIDAGSGVSLEVDGSEAEPLEVSRRVVWKRGATTPQVVVRRGGETLSIIDLQGFRPER